MRALISAYLAFAFLLVDPTGARADEPAGSLVLGASDASPNAQHPRARFGAGIGLVVGGLALVAGSLALGMCERDSMLSVGSAGFLELGPTVPILASLGGAMVLGGAVILGLGGRDRRESALALRLGQDRAYAALRLAF